jgi:hypothetical protein
MSDIGAAGWLMFVSAAVAIAAGVSTVRWLVRWLAAKSLLIPLTSPGRGVKTLSTVGHVAALASSPFALFLGITVGGTLGGGLGDTLARHWGAAIGVGVGIGAVTLVVASLAAIIGVLLCALVLRAVQK